MEPINRNRLLLIGVAVVVPFVAGLAMALWYGSSAELIMQFVGAFAVAVGVVQLTLRRVFEPDARADPAVLLRAERQALRRFRCMGVTSLADGVAQFSPDDRFRVVLMACGAALSVAGLLRVPRRLFEVTGEGVTR
jgi:hypothetical protein